MDHPPRMESFNQSIIEGTDEDDKANKSSVNQFLSGFEDLGISIDDEDDNPQEDEANANDETFAPTMVTEASMMDSTLVTTINDRSISMSLQTSKRLSESLTKGFSRRRGKEDDQEDEKLPENVLAPIKTHAEEDEALSDSDQMERKEGLNDVVGGDETELKTSVDSAEIVGGDLTQNTQNNSESIIGLRQSTKKNQNLRIRKTKQFVPTNKYGEESSDESDSESSDSDSSSKEPSQRSKSANSQKSQKFRKKTIPEKLGNKPAGQHQDIRNQQEEKPAETRNESSTQHSITEILEPKPDQSQSQGLKSISGVSNIEENDSSTFNNRSNHKVGDSTASILRDLNLQQITEEESVMEQSEQSSRILEAVSSPTKEKGHGTLVFNETKVEPQHEFKENLSNRKRMESTVRKFFKEFNKNKERIVERLKLERDDINKKIRHYEASDVIDADQMKIFYEMKRDLITRVLKINRKDFDDCRKRLKRKVDGLDNCNENELAGIQSEFSREFNIHLNRLNSCLPIYGHKEEIVEKIRKHKVVFIEGKPGCGKSTQVPQYMLQMTDIFGDANKFRIVFVVLPRRLAAKNLATRVTQEWSGTWSPLIKYYQESVTDEDLMNTRVVFLSDKDLYQVFNQRKIDKKRIGAIVIDEANLRHVYSDVIISMYNKLSELNEHLKLVILCTQINQDAYVDFLSDTDSVKIPQSNFPIRIEYVGKSETESQYGRILTQLRTIESAIYNRRSKMKKNTNSVDLKNEARARHVLVFMSDSRAIVKVYNQIKWIEEGRVNGMTGLNKGLKFLILMAHGATNFAEGEGKKVFEDQPENVVKIILSSKVLETSVTINNVGYVIDFGEERVYSYQNKLRVQNITMRKISKITAEQRAGRTGRVTRGVCYRMYSEDDYLEMESNPESKSRLLHENIDLLLLNFIKMIGANQSGSLFQSRRNSVLYNINNNESTISAEDMNDPIKALTREILDIMLLVHISEEDIKISIKKLQILGALDNKECKINKIGKDICSLGFDPKFARIVIEGKEKGILREILKVVASCENNNPIFQAYEIDQTVKAKKRQKSQEFASWGDFVLNYSIFNEYLSLGRDEDTKKNFCKENKYSYSGLRKAEISLKILKNRCRKVFKTAMKVDNNQQGLRTDSQKKDLYTKINQCVLTGFTQNCFTFINKRIGFFHHMGRFTVRVHNSSIYNQIDNEDMIPKMVSCAKVTKDEHYKFRWIFPIELQWIKPISYKIYKTIKINMENKVVPSVVLSWSLPSLIVKALKDKTWLIDRILGVRGSLNCIDARNFKMEIAVNEDEKDDVKKKIDSLIEDLTNYYKLEAHEIYLRNTGRVYLGDGLRVKGILAKGEHLALYLRYLPRRLFRRSSPPWSKIQEHLNKNFFEIELDPSKGEYASYMLINNEQNKDPNGYYATLKCYFSTPELMARSETQISKAVRKLNSLDFDSRKKLYNCEDPKQIVLQRSIKNIGSDVSRRKVVMRFKFSETENTGSATIKFQNILDISKVYMHLKEHQADGNGDVFGKNLEVFNLNEDFSSKEKDVVLKGLHPYVDEKYIKRKIKDLVHPSGKIKVFIKTKTEKKSGINFLKRWVKNIREKIFEPYMGGAISQDERAKPGQEIEQEEISPEFRISNFREHTRNSYLKRYKDFRCIEFEIDNYKTALQIKEKFNHSRKIIMNRIIHIKVSRSSIAFFPKKRFLKMRKYFKAANKDVEFRLTKDLHSGVYMDKYSLIRKKISKIVMPSEEILDEKDEKDWVMLKVIRGNDSKLADALERSFNFYTNGMDIQVASRCYVEMFDKTGRGQSLKQEIEDKYPFCFIMPMRSKNIWAVHCLESNAKEIEERIVDEMKKYSATNNQSYHYQLLGPQVECLQQKDDENENSIFKTKAEKLNHLAKEKFDECELILKVDRFEEILQINCRKDDKLEIKKFIGKTLKDWLRGKPKRTANSGDILNLEDSYDDWMGEDSYSDEDEEEGLVNQGLSIHEVEEPCEICSDRSYRIKLFGSGHVICRHCLYEYISDKLEPVDLDALDGDLNLNITIPINGDEVPLNFFDVTSVMVDSKISNSIRDRVIRMVNGGGFGGKYHYYENQGGDDFLKVSEDGKYFYCPASEVKLCAKTRQLWNEEDDAVVDLDKSIMEGRVQKD